MIIDDPDDELSHEEKRKYDPVKRREYYLKTRKLKGRRKTKVKGQTDTKKVASKSNQDPSKRYSELSDEIKKLEKAGKSGTERHRILSQQRGQAFAEAIVANSKRRFDQGNYRSKKTRDLNPFRTRVIDRSPQIKKRSRVDTKKVL